VLARTPSALASRLQSAATHRGQSRGTRSMPIIVDAAIRIAIRLNRSV
jgi:hypothetical protein